MEEQVAGQVANAGSTLTQTLLGSGFIVALGVALLAVWQLIRTQNDRVQDQKDIVEKVGAISEKTNEALEKVREVIEGLERTQQSTYQQLLQLLAVRK